MHQLHDPNPNPSPSPSPNPSPSPSPNPNQVQRVARQPEGSWRPVLVLLPLRLGLIEKTLNPAYVPCMCALFELRQSVGVDRLAQLRGQN